MQRTFRCCLGLFLFGAFLFAPSVAQAADSCDTPIIDSANVLDDSLVAAKVAKLQSVGAIVRVRSFDTAPMGSLDTYREAQVRNCASWRGADGRPAGTLAVFAFTVNDRKSNVYTGVDWATKMDPQVDNIRNQVMNPKLAAKQYSDGVMDAMDAVYSVLTDTAPPRPTTPAGDKPGSTSKFPMWILYVLGGLALASGTGFGLHRWHQRVLERRAAKADAIAARDHAAVVLNEILGERVKTVGLAVDYTTMGLAEKASSRLRQAWAEANTAVNAAFAANGRLSGYEDDIPKQDSRKAVDSNTMNPDADHTADEYDQIVIAYKEVAALAQTAANDLTEVEGECNKIDELVTTMGPATVALRDRSQELLRRQNSLKDNGYKVSTEEPIQTLDALIATIFKKTEANQPKSAADDRTDAEALATKIDAQLTRLSTIRQELHDRHTKATSTLHAVKDREASAAAVFNELQQEYNVACYQGVVRLPAETTTSLNAAGQLLTWIAAAIGMDVQDWDGASSKLDEVDDLTKRAASNCDAVNTCAHELAQLKARLASDVDALVRDAASASSSLGGLKGNQEGYRSSLSNLKRSAESLRGKIRQDKPDYRALSAECTRLDDEVKSALRQAKAEHQRVETEERRERERLAQQERDRQAAAAAAASSSTSSSTSSYDGGSNSSGSY